MSPSFERFTTSECDIATTQSLGPKDWLLAAVLAIVVFLVYQPAWHGGFLWDDAHHLTRPELRSLHGLERIWFELGATEQYYPLTHSVFWIEQKLWGDTPLGYHLVNIALHRLTAWLVFVLLRRLEVPGAFWAAAIFALHPLQVESVAWISELKNTLSAVFGLTAILAYLRFDRSWEKLCYTIAIVLFALTLLSKTVTAVLPAVLLVIFWWQRGRLDWRRDVLPLVPWLLLGAAAALCYGGMLFPALGFFNVYPFRYSFVADHFQYLAGLAIIALAVAGGTLFFRHCGPLRRLTGRVLGVSLVAVLALLSWRQSRTYADVETLYQTTLARNPDCWMAHNNLGTVLFGRGQMNEAIAHYEKALQIKSDNAEIYYNLGNALAGRGEVADEIVRYRQALQSAAISSRGAKRCGHRRMMSPC